MYILAVQPLKYVNTLWLGVYVAMVRYISVKPFEAWFQWEDIKLTIYYSTIALYIAHTKIERLTNHKGAHCAWLHVQCYWNIGFPSYNLWVYISYLLLKLVAYSRVHYPLSSHKFLFYLTFYRIIVYMFNNSHTILPPFTTCWLFMCAKQLALIRIVY